MCNCDKVCRVDAEVKIVESDSLEKSIAMDKELSEEDEKAKSKKLLERIEGNVDG